uniref:Uncharacterized protein n=1 Tax=Setaria digitata TaxID=48799 RepID=A0A915PR44_9BILA
MSRLTQTGMSFHLQSEKMGKLVICGEDNENVGLGTCALLCLCACADDVDGALEEECPEAFNGSFCFFPLGLISVFPLYSAASHYKYCLPLLANRWFDLIRCSCSVPFKLLRICSIAMTTYRFRTFQPDGGEKLKSLLCFPSSPHDRFHREWTRGEQCPSEVELSLRMA